MSPQKIISIIFAAASLANFYLHESFAAGLVTCSSFVLIAFIAELEKKHDKPIETEAIRLKVDHLTSNVEALMLRAGLGRR